MIVDRMRGVFACAIGLTMALGAAGSVASAQSQAALIVQNDRGGLIGARAREISDLNARDIQVQLRGRICYSSCTMYLGAEQVCVDPETIFGFHGPSQRGRALPPDRFEHWSAVMAGHYNAPLRDWFLSEARHRISGYYRISGASLIALGYQACSGNPDG
ncbi:hypothetical protein [Yoonia sp. BS5-3]|uniref:Uncharacterized protein n=1 Tax=Yoonia phaeophyticola TaxID=3137369 RepID=A0ABZ2V6A5_9RHOB